MCTHTNNEISVKNATLYGQKVDGIGGIRSPYLRAVEEHARIKVPAPCPMARKTTGQWARKKFWSNIKKQESYFLLSLPI